MTRKTPGPDPYRLTRSERDRYANAEHVVPEDESPACRECGHPITAHGQQRGRRGCFGKGPCSCRVFRGIPAVTIAPEPGEPMLAYAQRWGLENHHTRLGELEPLVADMVRRLDVLEAGAPSLRAELRERLELTQAGLVGLEAMAERLEERIGELQAATRALELTLQRAEAWARRHDQRHGATEGGFD